MNNAVQDAVPVEVEVARSDADLVARFVSANDQAAFAELVRRHSGLVMGVCRRVLRDAHDIDDVFQATFLVFVRDAARVRKQASLASWLYGVAYRLAVRVAQQKQRRRETVLVDDTAIGGDALAELADRYDQQLVDAELNALPERYRRPLVLKYLVGKSPRDVAIELGITVGAVEGLLKRGKDELRARLMRRGVKLGAAVIAVQMTRQSVQAACPETLIEATVQTGLAWNSANISALDLISDRVLELAGKELATMTALTKTGLAIGLTTGALALGLGGAGFLVSQLPGRASAGIVSTLPVSNSSSRGLVTTALAADPNATGVQVDTNVALPQPSTSENAPATKIDFAAGAIPGADSSAKAVAPAANAAGKWDLKPRSPAVVKIEHAMTEPTEIDFIDVSLKDVVSFLNEFHKLSILIDAAALEEEGMDPEHLVTLKVSEITLRSGLDVLLEPLNLDYVIKNEVMMITSRSKAEGTLETRVYDTSRLSHLLPENLIRIVEDAVSPDLWVNVGGVGVVTVASPNTLVIRQTQRVHREIVELLEQLAQVKAAPTKTPADLGGRSGGSKPTTPPPASSFGGFEGATGGGFGPAAKELPGSSGSVPTKPAR